MSLSKNFILFLLIVLSLRMLGQIQIGFKGGTNVAKLYSGSNSFKPGGYLSIPIVFKYSEKFSISPELSFVQYNASFTSSYGTPEPYYIYTMEYNMLHHLIPVYFEYHFTKNIFVQAAPFIGYVIRGTYEDAITTTTTDSITGFSETSTLHTFGKITEWYLYNRKIYGWNAGITYTLPTDNGEFRANLNYGRFMSSFYSSTLYSPKFKSFQVTIAYLFNFSENPN